MPAATARRTRWLDIGMGLVVLVVVIVVGRIAMFGRDDPPPSQPSQGGGQGAAAGGFSPGDQQIIGLLPPGFNAANCSPAADPFPNAVASLDCSQNPGSGNPNYARFTLYEDLETLTDDFAATAEDMVLSPCPGGNPWGPGTWTLGGNTGQVGGKIVCGTVDDRPNIAWTRDAQLILATVNGGADLNNLYQWWQRYGGITQQ